MNIQFECEEKVNGILTVTIEQSDYQQLVDKKLKDFRKKAQMPGFRPGMVPMGLIKRQYGQAAKAEEVNNLLSESITKYITDNKIAMLGHPMPNEQRQTPQDLATDGPFTFVFDIAVAPEIDATLSKDDTVDYYDIQVDDKLIDQQVEMFQKQIGEFVETEEWSGNDTLNGDLRQLDDEGNTLEDGITTQGAVIMPSYIKGEDEKKKFDGAKPGDIIIFNPRKAYPESDAEVAALLKVDKEKIEGMTSDFSFQVTSIRHFQEHAVDKDLFEKVFPDEEIADEAAFRAKVAEQIKAQLNAGSDMQFFATLRKHIEERVGDVVMPEQTLKRILRENNKDKDEDFVERNFPLSLRHLKWQLIKEEFIKQTGIKVDDNDIKMVAMDAIRQQFAQYGMSNIPVDVLENYAEEQIKKGENNEAYIERAVDIKLMQATRDLVTLNVKPISLDDFNKMVDEENKKHEEE